MKTGTIYLSRRGVLVTENGRQTAGAAILCGGRGRRLGCVTQRIPKALVPISGQPIIFRVIEQIVQAGIPEITFVIDYRGEQVKQAVDHYFASMRNPPTASWVQQAYPGAEGALLTGATVQQAPRTLVRCCDDLLSDKVFAALLSSPGTGAVMSREVPRSPLPRLAVRDHRVVGITSSPTSPIMTYNLCLDSELLRSWSKESVTTSYPLVYHLTKYLTPAVHLSHINGADTVGINTPKSIVRANQWIQIQERA